MKSNYESNQFVHMCTVTGNPFEVEDQDFYGSGRSKTFPRPRTLTPELVPLSWENFLLQNTLKTLLFEVEDTSLLQLITIISQL